MLQLLFCMMVTFDHLFCFFFTNNFEDLKVQIVESVTK